MKLIKARVTSDEKMQLEKEMIILSGGVVFENKKQDTYLSSSLTSFLNRKIRILESYSKY